MPVKAEKSLNLPASAFGNFKKHSEHFGAKNVKGNILWTFPFETVKLGVEIVFIFT